MGYSPSAGYLSIECGDFDLSEKFFTKEIKEIEKHDVDVEIHFLDVQRIIDEQKKNKDLPHGGGFVLPNTGELLISIFTNPFVVTAIEAVLTAIITKAIDVYWEKHVKKAEKANTIVENNSSVEIFETEDTKYLKISGLSEKSAEEIAKKYINTLKDKK